MTMNHRTSPSTRTTSAILATQAIAQDAADEKDDEIRYGSDHAFDCCSCNHKKKHKDYKYDRNTIFIAMTIFFVYAFANVLQEIVVLDAGTMMTFGWTQQHQQRSSSDVSHSNFRKIETLHNHLPKKSQQQRQQQQSTLGLPKQPPRKDIVVGERTIESSHSPPLSTTSANFNHLNLQAMNGTLVTLVHIGKTGGSALRDLIDYAVGYCKINYLKNNNDGPPPPIAEGSLFKDAHRHERTTLQKHMCALARTTNSKGIDDGTNSNGLVHLDRNLHKTLSEKHFLVPIRNPVDRLVSWFHYERHFQTIKKTRYSRTLNELIDPSRCGFSSVEELFLGTTKSTTKKINSSKTATDLDTTTSIPKVATPDYCYRLSRECLSGEIPCYGHNFFNYEYYLEDILVRILQGAAAFRETETTTSNKDETQEQHQRLLEYIPRVDVIRTERSWDDLNQTLLEWTGLAMTPDMDFFYLNRKPFDVDTHNDENNNEEEPSSEAVKSLCETICPELIAYSKLIKYAANLSPMEKKRTSIELDTTCGFQVEEVCGKAFRYRRVREAKQLRMCEPRKRAVESPSGENDDGQSRQQQLVRHRRLTYLKGQDLPSC